MHSKSVGYLRAMAAAMLLAFSIHYAPASQASDNDSLLNESFQQFDQTLGAGWRDLVLQQKYADAAVAIQKYRELHAMTLSSQEDASLEFHLGNVYALLDQRDKAIYWFRQALASKALGNPAYPQAHVAFLAKDKPALLAARNTLATTNPGPWREGDLKEVDAMIKYFGQPFEVVFGALNCESGPLQTTSPLWPSYCKALRDKYAAIYH